MSAKEISIYKWVGSILSAIMGALVPVQQAMIIAPATFNWHDGLYNTINLGFMPAMGAVLLFLKQQPLPGLKVNDKGDLVAETSKDSTVPTP